MSFVDNTSAVHRTALGSGDINRGSALKGAKKARTRVGNGNHLFAENIDWRTSVARRFKELVGDIIVDLGGMDQLSASQIQLVRRASMLSAECEQQELLAARGDTEFDCDAYVTKTNCLRRLIETLGLKRAPRVVGGPVTLDSIVQHIGAQRPLASPPAASTWRPAPSEGEP